jgi:hypothetical protein
MANEIRILATLKDTASKGVQKLNDNLAGVKRTAGIAGHALVTLAKVAAIAAIALAGALVIGLGKAVQSASNLEEQMNKVAVVFGPKASKPLIEWSKTTARALGISQVATLSAIGTFGNLFRSMKIGLTPSRDMSKSLVTLAADMASFNNASPEDVLLAIRAGLVGEVEPLRKFGINLNDARLREEALRLGLVKSTKEVLPAAVKAQAAYSLIMKDSSLAQGDFARTSSSLANQQRIAGAVVEDSFAKIGAAIVPVAAKILPILVSAIADVATWINDKLIPAVSGWYERNKPLVNQIISFVGGALATFIAVAGQVASAIGGVIAKVQKWLSENRPLVTMVTNFASAVLGTLITVLGRVASVIGTVIGFLVRLFDKVTANKQVMDILRRSVGFVANVMGVVARAIGKAVDALVALVRWTKEAIQWLSKLNLITPNRTGAGPNAPYHPQYNPGGQRAKGGPVSAGGMYLVGEKGPEMFRPSTSGTIIPNNAMGGGTVVVNYSPTYSSATPSEARAFVQSITPALTRELRRQGVL